MKLGKFFFLALTLFLTIMSAPCIMSAFATSRSPGVTPGQFLHYSDNMTRSGNDTLLISNLTRIDKWVNETIISVSGANVTTKTIEYNATWSVSGEEIINVEEGTVNGTTSGPALFLIAANLNASDALYVNSPYYVNDTVEVNYLNQQFEAVHLTFGNTATNVHQFGYVYNSTSTSNYYWDRNTGILLDASDEDNISRSNGTGSILTYSGKHGAQILSATPPLSVPELPTLLILPLFIVGSLSATLTCRNKTPRIREPKQQPQNNRELS
jgi:hypothetical protein